MPKPGVIRIAQITDMHLMASPDATHRGVATRETFSQVMAMPAWDSKVDGLLCTGDNSEDGSQASYAYLKQALDAFDLPYVLMAGNHDRFASMQAVFDPSQLADTVMVFPGWLLIGLNSQVPGEVHGAISKEQVMWLQAQMQAHSERHVVLALHHPIAPIGCAWLDRIALHDGPAFCEQLATYPNLKAVLTGHAHTDYQQRIGHFDWMITPSTAYQHDAQSDTMRLTEEPPGMRMLALHPDGKVESRIHRIGA